MDVLVSERLLWKRHFNVQFCLRFCWDARQTKKGDKIHDSTSGEVQMCLCMESAVVYTQRQAIKCLFYYIQHESVCCYADVCLGLSLSSSMLTHLRECQYDAPTSWSSIFLTVLTSPFELTRLLPLHKHRPPQRHRAQQDTRISPSLLQFSCYILSCLLISGQTVYPSARTLEPLVQKRIFCWLE